VAFKAALRLTRPRQWPILTAQVLVGVLLFFALQEPGQSLAYFKDEINWLVLLNGWFVWVVLLNGGTLAFNSAFDRDVGPVAYLDRPPVPPAHLATTMFLVMLFGVIWGWFTVSPAFGGTVAGCLALSVLYSHSLTRWKGIPGLDLLVNILGYGAGTTLGGMLVGSAMHPANFPPAGIFFIAGFGLLFGSLYPLTQIYQVQQDLQRGDRTMASALGVKAALAAALALGIAASASLLAGILTTESGSFPVILVGGLSLWLVHLLWWWLHTDSMDDAQHEKGMYRALGLWALVDITLLAEILLR